MPKVTQAVNYIGGREMDKTNNWHYQQGDHSQHSLHKQAALRALRVRPNDPVLP